MFPVTLPTHHPKLDHVRIDTYGYIWMPMAYLWFWGCHICAKLHLSEKLGHAQMTSNSWLLSILKYNVAGIVQPMGEEHYRLPDISMKICPLAYQITASFVVTVDIVTICVRHQLQVPETVQSSGP